MKKYFILAAVAATFAACSFDKDLGESHGSTIVQQDKSPLTVGYSVGNIGKAAVSTRSNLTNIQNEAILTSNTLGVFILKQGETTPTSPQETFEHLNIASNALTSNSPTTNYVGATFTDTDPSKAIFYPDMKSQGLDIYAYAPRISSTSYSTTASYIPSTWSNISTDVITFYTQPDQTAENDYKASDVLWGAAGGGTTSLASAYTTLSSTGNSETISAEAYNTAKSKFEATTDGGLNSTPGTYKAYYVSSASQADVVIPMLHRGSKIVINLKASGMEYAKLQKAKVTHGVEYLQGTLNLSTGTYEKTGSSSPTDVVLTTRLGWDGTSATEGEYQESTTTVGYTCSAVIAPQQVAKANGKIKIQLWNDSSSDYTGGTYVYTPSEDSTTFLSGKVYTYTITVTASGLTVTTSVHDWETGATPSGSATLE